jgi:two-component system sensor histidine kinase CpxA
MKMNSLFFKIFISFWLTLILFAGSTIWLASNYLDDIRSEHNTSGLHARMAGYSQEAQRIISAGDPGTLKKWLIQLDHHEVIPILLIDHTGEDLLGRPVPARIVRRIERWNHRLNDNDGDREHRSRPRVRRLIVAPEGNRYWLVPDYQSITLGRVLKRPHVIAIPVLLATIIGGLVCFALARYLTAPLGRLKQATERMASGELNHRVAPGLRGRKDEIADLAEAFDYMAERLEQLVGSHKQLLRDASHELRSPLARLQVALGLTRQRADASLDAELDRIERETERLNELIGQLLSLARLESGGVSTTKSEIDLEGLLKEITEDASFEARANNKGVNLEVEVDGTIIGDEVLLHSAIENVVRNAVRYTRPETSVEVRLRKDSGSRSYLITVCDHGPGVPEAILPHLFEPFVRVAEARDRESGGYGLGLAIADRAIRLHGGRITASNLAGGVCMEISLPA